MKFEIQTKEFTDALRIASVAVLEGGRTLPILGNIKIEAKDDQVILSTTNLDLYVIQKLPAKVSKEGATTAPYSILSQLVNRMESSSIFITLSKTEIEFKSGDVTALIETLDASEFPPPLPQDRTAPVECDAVDIIKPFQMLAHAISKDTSRYLLTGINYAPSKKGAGDFAATDARRIVTYSGIKLAEEDVIIPDVFVNATLKVQPEGRISVIISNGIMTIISSEIELSAKLIEGKFPNWREPIPDRSKSAFSCGRKALISALQTCAIFTKRQTPGLQLAGKGKEIEVSQPGKVTAMVLGTELSGQPDVSIILNSTHLIETLNVFEANDIRIQYTDENKPVLIEEGPLRAVLNRMIPPQ